MWPLRRTPDRCFLFFCGGAATPGIYPLSLHDALPIFAETSKFNKPNREGPPCGHWPSRNRVIDNWLAGSVPTSKVDLGQFDRKRTIEHFATEILSAFIHIDGAYDGEIFRNANVDPFRICFLERLDRK